MAIEWKASDRGNNHSAKIGNLGFLTVDYSWDADKKAPYVVKAFGIKLIANSVDVADGKARAEKLARQLIAEAAAVLAE